MIDPNALPSWEDVFLQLALRPLRRGRAACPLCEGSNGTAFSSDEAKGFNCFRCGAHGDKLDFVEQYLGCDFTGALRWFGIEPGKPPAPDSSTIRKRKIKAGLLRWAETLGRKLRLEFRVREQVITMALGRLRLDHDDAWGWAWLGWALPGKDQIGMLLDQIDIGTEAQQVAAFKRIRRAA